MGEAFKRIGGESYTKTTGNVFSDMKEKDDRLARLRQRAAKAPEPDERKEDTTLDNINAVVGAAKEQSIPLDELTTIDEFRPDWNVFPPVDDEKMQEIAQSIYNYGLLHRITVWAQPGGRCIILGGHTRVRAYRYILSLVPDDEKDRFTSIPAKVYGAEQLTEDDAHRIFLVSNIDQRQFSTRTTVNAYSAMMKLEKRKVFYGKGVFAKDSVARQANVRPTTLYRYLRLNHLVDGLMKAVEDKKINIRVGVELSFLAPELQEYVLKKCDISKLTEKVAAGMHRKAKTKEDVDDIIDVWRGLDTLVKQKLTVMLNVHGDYDVIPLVVPRDKKDELTEKIKYSVSHMRIDTDIKKTMLDGIDNTTVKVK